MLLTLCAAVLSAASLPAALAGPPLPLIVPGPAQQAAQAQLAVQQAQAQANAAASQARLQAQLDANQARLEGQVAAQEQSQLDASRRGLAPPAPTPVLPLTISAAMQVPLRGPIGTMELARLTPQLGHYFGIDHGLLVVRAPADGALDLQGGDVILSIGGRVPESSSQAIRILASYDPGQRIGLVVMRKYHKIDITATMPGPRQASAKAAATRSPDFSPR